MAVVIVNVDSEASSGHCPQWRITAVRETWGESIVPTRSRPTDIPVDVRHALVEWLSQGEQ